MPRQQMGDPIGSLGSDLAGAGNGSSGTTDPMIEVLRTVVACSVTRRIDPEGDTVRDAVFHSVALAWVMEPFTTPPPDVRPCALTVVR